MYTYTYMPSVPCRIGFRRGDLEDQSVLAPAQNPGITNANVERKLRVMLSAVLCTVSLFKEYGGTQ